MLIKPPEGRAEIEEFYEFDPSIHVLDGMATPAWEAKMVLVTLPRPLLFLGEEVHRVRVHQKIAVLTRMTFEAVAREGLWEAIKDYSGSYVWRAKRNAPTLSLHAFGAALDFAAARNAMGKPIGETQMGGTRDGWKTVLLFESFGWEWGGWWQNPDAMHLQFGRGY